MRTSLLTFALILLMPVSASAWAILLKTPELQFPAGHDPAAAAAAQTALQKIPFQGGVIHVSAPQPTRYLRFTAPGQAVTDLLPLLSKLGFTVTVLFSDTLPAEMGFHLRQPEDGSNTLSIVINTEHPDFKPSQLTLQIPPSLQGDKAK